MNNQDYNSVQGEIAITLPAQNLETYSMKQRVQILNNTINVFCPLPKQMSGPYQLFYTVENSTTLQTFKNGINVEPHNTSFTESERAAQLKEAWESGLRTGRQYSFEGDIETTRKRIRSEEENRANKKYQELYAKKSQRDIIRERVLIRAELEERQKKQIYETNLTRKNREWKEKERIERVRTEEEKKAKDNMRDKKKGKKEINYKRKDGKNVTGHCSNRRSTSGSNDERGWSRSRAEESRSRERRSKGEDNNKRRSRSSSRCKKKGKSRDRIYRRRHSSPPQSD